jgi:Fe-S-cluster-containing hydrogenase component 2
MLICSFMHTDGCSYHGSRIQIVSEEGHGIHTPTLCQFCEDPSCVNACPTAALSKNSKTDAIQVDASLCNGCQACVGACPFQAMFFDPEEQKPFTCDLCQGDPECVKICRLPETLQYA